VIDFGELSLEDLVGKLVSIGCNDNIVFQGHRTRVTQQFKEKVVLFVTRVHCFAQKTNITVITLFDVSLMHRLEFLLHSLYIFFAQSSNFFAQFQKLADLLQTKGNKLF
jgi:hypothetical protein